MSFLKHLLSRWPVFAAALVAAGIVHICTVFAMPYLYRSDAVSRLQRTLPINAFVILPQARPRAQVLPYQTPDARYAICRFDLSEGPLVVRALLAEPGWTLTAYGPGGESFYSIPAPEQRRISLNLLVLPGGERFLGPMHDARSLDQDVSQVTSPHRSGLIVIQAPLKGRTYMTEIEQALSQATCRKLSY
jgi:uncharacterized membrane protein